MQGVSQGQMRRWARIAATVALAVVASYLGHKGSGRIGSGDAAPDRISGAGRVIDGDSLYVGGFEVRLKDIDAPEGRQSCAREGNAWACGDAARDELRALIGRDQVDCRVTERDKHSRLLAYCSTAGRDLNRVMVSSGYAVAFGGYGSEEAAARRDRRGIWGSQFERPQAWRRARGIGR